MLCITLWLIYTFSCIYSLLWLPVYVFNFMYSLSFIVYGHLYLCNSYGEYKSSSFIISFTGMVMMGKGTSMIGLNDLNIANQLCLLMNGGHRSADMVSKQWKLNSRQPHFLCYYVIHVQYVFYMNWLCKILIGFQDQDIVTDYPKKLPENTCHHVFIKFCHKLSHYYPIYTCWKFFHASI